MSTVSGTLFVDCTYDTEATMQFLEGFGRQKKESKIAYSTVEVDTDSSRLEQRTHRQPTTIQGWPVGPQRVGNFPSWIVIDFVLLFLPIAFIGQYCFALHWVASTNTLQFLLPSHVVLMVKNFPVTVSTYKKLSFWAPRYIHSRSQLSEVAVSGR
jgi:hypothetical protein